MTREEKNLEKLLKVAAATSDERRRHVANLEAALASAQTSRDWLKQTASAESNAVLSAENPNLYSLQSYMGGVEEKSRALDATCERLTREIDDARAELADAFREVKKIEHLLEVRRKTAQKNKSRRATAQSTEMATRGVR